MDQLNQKQFRTPTAIMGIFDLLRLASLRTRLEDWSCKMKQNKWDTLFNWYLEASKHIWDSKIASLQNTISKLINVNQQLKEDKRKKKTFEAPFSPFPYFVSIPTSFIPSSSSFKFSHWTLVFPETVPTSSPPESVRTCPIRVIPSADSHAKPLTSNVLQNKAQL